MTLERTMTAERTVEPVPDLYRSFNWSNELVWLLPLPTIEIPIADIAWHLRACVWSTLPRKRLFNLRPLTVIGAPDEHRWHYERILAARVEFPIDVAETDEGDVILDGMHRLARLWLERSSRIRIRRVPREQMHVIQSDEFPDD